MNRVFTFMRESTVARFFIPLGLILVIFGIIVFSINTKNQNYIKTEAIVLDVEVAQEAYVDTDGNQVEATYNATIKYTVSDKEYETTLDNVSKYKVGDNMTIYYNPKDPSQITQTKSLILPIVIILCGIASLTGGIISLFNVIKKNKRMTEQERSWKDVK